MKVTRRVAASGVMAAAWLLAISGASAQPGGVKTIFNSGPIVASFARPTTTYEIRFSAPAGTRLTFTWSKEGSPCGTFGPNGGPEIAWRHPDRDLGGDCPTEEVHPAVITVVVSDGVEDCTIVYRNGSAPGVSTEPTSCKPVAVAPPTSATPPSVTSSTGVTSGVTPPSVVDSVPTSGDGGGSKVVWIVIALTGVAVGGAGTILIRRERDGTTMEMYTDWVPRAGDDPAYMYDDSVRVPDERPPVVRADDDERPTGTDTREDEQRTEEDEETEEETDDGGVAVADPCAELIAACEAAKLAASAAADAARTARGKAAAAKQPCDDARKEVTTAENELKAAQKTKPSANSWVEDAQTGERVTTDDVHLKNDAAQAAWNQYKGGDISAQELVDKWNQLDAKDGLKQLKDKASEAKQQKVDEAKKKVEEAKAKAKAACDAADKAAADAAAADRAAADAQAKADAACKAAADCGEKAKPPDKPVVGGDGAGGTTVDGGGTGTGGGKTPPPPPPPPPPKKPDPCQDSDPPRYRTLETSPVWEIPAPGAKVHVSVVDQLGVEAVNQDYDPGQFFETTPPELRGKQEPSANVGALRYYDVHITIATVEVQYECQEKWECRGGVWVMTGKRKHEKRSVEHTNPPRTLASATAPRQVYWRDIQPRVLRPSWAALGKLLEAQRQAENFCWEGRDG